MVEAWTARTERSNRFALTLLVWIARGLGRRAARLVLHGVVVYFLVTAPSARAASRDYLRRVLDRRPRWLDLYRHLYAFAAVGLDRMYMFGERSSALAVTPDGLDVFRRYHQQGQGAIIMVAHMGSFDILRALSRSRGDAPVRVLMDRSSGAKVNAVLDTVSPDTARRIIDTSESDVDRVLKVKAALDRGEMIGLMADRYREGERTADCEFLGGSAPLPLSPWLLAGITRAPVLLAFGLYRGGNRYDLYCEEFSPGLTLARANRSEQAQHYAQAYADRLAHFACSAPYNWFNFYRFWHE